MGAGTPVVMGAATNGSYNGVSGLLNGAASAGNVNGVDTTGLSAGANTFAANTLRYCTDGANAFAGTVAEGGLLSIGLNATQRGNLYTNMHGANGYNGAF